MNIRDLQYLKAVADLRNFTAAAEFCHVSQPTLSTQIRKLEDSLGVAIFERSNKQVLITEAGQPIIEAAKRALLEIEVMRDHAREAKDPFAGTLRLGAFPTLAPYYLPTAVDMLRSSFPKLTLRLVEDKTDRLVTQLLAGELDAALLAYPLAEERLQHARLFTDPFLLAVGADHPLAQASHVTPSQLLDYDLLLLEEGHCLREQALEVCQLGGFYEQQEFRATSLETLRQMVRAGSGITLIPQIALRADPAICAIPFAPPAPARHIGLFWRKTSSKQKLLAQIAALLRGE